MKYYLVAGEASGDLHGANFIRLHHSCLIFFTWPELGALLLRTLTSFGSRGGARHEPFHHYRRRRDARGSRRHNPQKIFGGGSAPVRPAH